MGYKANEMRAKRERQFEFELRGLEKPNASFGGESLKNSNPKKKRPLHSKLPIFLTLRANQGGLRLPKTYGRVSKAIEETSKKYGVRIYKEANVGNHIHLGIRVTKLSLWPAFIRELTGRIAQEVTAAGVKLKAEKFWMYRPHTRIVQGWKRAFKIVMDYIYLNQIEAEGFIDRKQTKTLKDLRAIFDG
jgi:hypothetical protein